MAEGRIITVTHKAYQMPEDKQYLPVCVGKNIPILAQVYQPDNQGDNISEKNATYCELTAIYWAWKNLNVKALDYVGVAHYRRYMSESKRAHTLDKAISGERMKVLSRELDDTVLVLPKSIYLTSLEKHYIHSLKGYEDVHRKDIQRLREAIHCCAPEYDCCADNVLTSNCAHMKNMFIMSGENYDAYCSWLFPVIDAVVDRSVERCDQNRYAGALSEFCLDIWIMKNGLKTREMFLLETEPVSFGKRVWAYMKRKFRNR